MSVFIIDANNIMHKDAELKSKIKKDYLNACSAFLAQIRAYAYKYPSFKFVVVFDGFTEGLESNYANIRVGWSFSRTADEVIKEYIRDEYTNKCLKLASSDTNLHNFAKIHSIDVYSAEDFLSMIKAKTATNKTIDSSKNTNLGKSEKPNSASRKEVNEMLRLFGLDDK
jgi:predicted RNA-binding protein with PIN domain